MSEVRLQSPGRLPLDEQREHLMVRIAKLYYELEWTQGDIATELGLTRWQIGRLLTEAREIGVVRIEITPRVMRRTDLEVRLQQDFGLKDAVVVPSGGAADSALLTERVAQAAATYLAGLMPKPGLIGVSWGRTMSAVARFLPNNWNPGVHVVLLNGATNLRSTSSHSNAVAEEFARAGNGSATLLPVPAIVGKRSTREVLEDDPVIERVLKLALEAEIVCFGMGGMNHQSVLLGNGYLDAAGMDTLRDAGAVGDILGRFIGEDGQIIDSSIDDRTVGMRLQHLKTKQRAIGVVAGEDKHQVAAAALKADYVSVIITDEATALYALDNHNRGRAG
ncbi:sugar-binding transcriptional regulator [Phyllobacterium endophyticum]|uniref:DNA-binding transcriptional regulator n=1 Tax=Phyllobacterium endophyticum TaxID=1149773 RepID=A0A2P7AMS7_9HYPH|nr:sugar-binding transcriptional regulator [Phyllobacterium endophyticum]MBB3238237.1 deoxyribonucleoside regulator [Phyllobacterium endophyticum]PSH55517.1 DNA-binding transcriptional regulator [Phyllobacterium endophyticum]TYR40254.1 sugar-binding transcriptional regulator [Phyllobacterium endophyticum]